EPLETGTITISRAQHRAEYPARFQLVAALNPCPCGWLGHPRRRCVCTPDQVARYRHRLSGPLLDRIDIHLDLAPADSGWIDAPAGEPSSVVAVRVFRARQPQPYCQKVFNAHLAPPHIEHSRFSSTTARGTRRTA